MKRKPGVWVVVRKDDGEPVFGDGTFRTRFLAVNFVSKWHLYPKLYTVARYVKEK